MTPGPTKRTEMALPRNRPVPMAPPMEIMESWREVRLRWRPASRARTSCSAAGTAAGGEVGCQAMERASWYQKQLAAVAQEPAFWRCELSGLPDGTPTEIRP